MEKINIQSLELGDSRQKQRSILINLFLKEKPGTGKGDGTSRYKYIVKDLNDGRQVFLQRPAQFNNGFDFTINVSDTNFNKGLEGKRQSTRPTHENILTDLRLKKLENPFAYKRLLEQIELVYKCQDYSPNGFEFIDGHDVFLLLECIKWLFIEQDVTYWNYSGRNMFYSAIKNI